MKVKQMLMVGLVSCLVISFMGSVALAGGVVGKLLRIPLTDDEQLWFSGATYSIVMPVDDAFVKYDAWHETSEYGVGARVSASIRNGAKFAIKVASDPTYSSDDGRIRDIIAYFGAIAATVSGDAKKGVFTVLQADSRTVEAGVPFPLAVGLFGLESYNGDGSVPTSSDGLNALLLQASSWWVIYCKVI